MRKKLYSLTAIVISGILVAGLLISTKTSATVPGTNSAIDVNTSGGIPNSYAGSPAISQNGRYVAFQSASTNLVSTTTNGQYQIYVRDRFSGTTTLASISSSGTVGNSYSTQPRISSDGKYVVFTSNSSNLVSGDTNAKTDAFIHNMATGNTDLISKNVSGTISNGYTETPDITFDGRYVVFSSYATNLVTSPSVTSGNHIYLKDLSNGTVKLLSQSSTGSVANADSWNPRISCEGRTVVFQSYANNLVSGDTNNPSLSKSRIYVEDLLNGIDPVYITGTGNDNMVYPSVSCNGNYVGFSSDASNLVSGDTNSSQDTFIFDRNTSTIERISINSSSTQGNDSSYGLPGISNDGRYVVFSSDATNFASGDTNGVVDIFLRNREAGTTELLSRNSGGTISNGNNSGADLSSDGRYATYASYSNNLVSGFSNTNTSIFTSQTGASYDY